MGTTTRKANEVTSRLLRPFTYPASHPHLVRRRLSSRLFSTSAITSSLLRVGSVVSPVPGVVAALSMPWPHPSGTPSMSASSSGGTYPHQVEGAVVFRGPQRDEGLPLVLERGQAVTDGLDGLRNGGPDDPAELLEGSSRRLRYLRLDTRRSPSPAPSSPPFCSFRLTPAHRYRSDSTRLPGRVAGRRRSTI